MSLRIALVVGVLSALFVPAATAAPPSGVVVAHRAKAHAVVVADAAGRLRVARVRGTLPAVGRRVTGRGAKLRVGATASEARITGTVTTVKGGAHTVRAAGVTLLISGVAGHTVGRRVSERVRFLPGGGLELIGTPAAKRPRAGRGSRVVELRGSVLELRADTVVLELADGATAVLRSGGVDLSGVAEGDAVRARTRRATAADGTVVWTLLALELDELDADPGSDPGSDADPAPDTDAEPGVDDGEGEDGAPVDASAMRAALAG